MNKKIASLLLICVVAISFIYSCSIALSSSITQSLSAAPSRPNTITEESRQKIKPSSSRPRPGILGDPIDDPKPHKK